MSYKAVLFDLDGTLLDTIDDLTDSMNHALEQLGLPARTPAECKFFVGDGIVAYAERAMGKACEDKDLLARCIALSRGEYSKRWAVKTRPYDGIPELLDELVRRGLKMTVLSNKPDDFTRLMVARLLPKWPFELVWGESAQRTKKPDPASAIQMAREMSLRPEEFLYLGDTNTDMRTAVLAGMYPVGVLWGFRPAEELLANGARVLIEHPMDTLKLL